MKLIYLNSTNFIPKGWCKKVNSESRDFFFVDFSPNTPLNTHISIKPSPIITKIIEIFSFDSSFSAVRNKPQKAFFPFWWLFTSYIVMGNSYWRAWPIKNPQKVLINIWEMFWNTRMKGTIKLEVFSLLVLWH